MRYAGLASQMLVSLGVAVYLGYLADTKLIKAKIPVVTIVAPVIVLLVMLYSIIRQTSQKQKR